MDDHHQDLVRRFRLARFMLFFHSPSPPNPCQNTPSCQLTAPCHPMQVPCHTHSPPTMSTSQEQQGRRKRPRRNHVKAVLAASIAGLLACPGECFTPVQARHHNYYHLEQLSTAPPPVGAGRSFACTRGSLADDVVRRHHSNLVGRNVRDLHGARRGGVMSALRAEGKGGGGGGGGASSKGSTKRKPPSLPQV